MYNLITASPKDWVARTNVRIYAERQAQSCRFLERVFGLIIARVSDVHGRMREDLSAVFDYLLVIHLRQYKDLEAVTSIPQDENRKSHYFDSMYSNYGLVPLALPEQLDASQLFSLLGIQAVSYMRGCDRYEILRNYTDPTNSPFKAVWARFLMDATRNAIKVSELMARHWDGRRTDDKIQEVLMLEDLMMKQIWRHNHVTGN